jgi:hypothetical protein
LVDFELILSSEYVFATHEMMRPFKTPKNSTNYLEPNDVNEQKNSLGLNFELRTSKSGSCKPAFLMDLEKTVE